jgi:hypothetical protein
MLILIWFFIILCVSAVNEAFPQTVVIPEETKIKVLIDSDLSTSQDPVNSTIYYKVAESVSLFNVIVIESGNPVKARITEIKKKGPLGKPGKIAVTIESVQAEDGTFVPIKPFRISHKGKSKKTKSLLMLPLLGLGYFIKGGEATIPEGDTLTVKTKARHFLKID